MYQEIFGLVSNGCGILTSNNVFYCSISSSAVCVHVIIIVLVVYCNRMRNKLLLSFEAPEIVTSVGFYGKFGKVFIKIYCPWASQVALVKNLLVNAGDTGDMGSVHGLGRSPGGWQPTPESQRQRRLVGGLQSMELQKWEMSE